MEKESGTKSIEIEIETRDGELVSDLMETSSPSIGQQKSIPGGATVTFKGEFTRKTFGFPLTIELAISIGVGVISGLIANWLNGKIKGRAATLRIDRREVQIEKGEIKRVIEERIQKNE